MKKTVLFLSLFSVSACASAEFQKFDEIEPHLYQSKAILQKGNIPLQFQLNNQCLQPQSAVKLNQEISLTACNNEIPQLRIFRSGNYTAQIDLRSGTPTLRIVVEKEAEKQTQYSQTCPKWNGKAVEINVSNVFAEGESVQDFYSGQTDTVKNGKVTFTPDKNAAGLILLEKSAVQNSAVFNWKNATVYFVLTDRFYNGDSSNDNSYGRHKDGMQEIGTFHGGDLKGLTEKLDYLADLGVNALWISSPLEQMHGWVGGGSNGDFPHYAYHGYYHQDWTKVDANMGSEQDLADFIRQAHQRGIRVIFDVVMNHTGYATLADMQEFGFGSLYLKDNEILSVLGKKWTNWQPKSGQNWHSFNDYINFGDKAGWAKWWNKDWVRSDIGDYDSPKFDDLKMSLSSLPDLKTENESAVGLPPFFHHKETNAKTLDNAKVRDYLITWLSHWVRKYGVDGFRVDTAKHVEQSTWLQLKQSAQQALREWQNTHPQEKFNDEFWMTGEAWGHGVMKSGYFQNGFDSMINFDFQDQAKNALDCFAYIEPTYVEMNAKLQDFDVLSYLSSHDTRLFFHSDSQNDTEKQKIAANSLLLAPSAVQIYYGDESGREFGPIGSDPMQGTRSDMNWQELATNPAKQQLLQHWQKLAKFRQKHTALGAGQHKTLETERYYAFSREQGDDKVMVIWAGK
ncbi:alpha-amylase [Cricetibacter osteomyelitidis]|uniref:Alpha-amylase n=1 Tax=Cricetibacter osteomyelitidis TaxID=1521931 RepID=A0A4R2SSP2_9PAST|nr:alpha-amylase [Cricetibacter osteomyelitidis]TCP93367.1 alpha-amylase [Cricetibacter osteomyelitidis]